MPSTERFRLIPIARDLGSAATKRLRHQSSRRAPWHVAFKDSRLLTSRSAPTAAHGEDVILQVANRECAVDLGSSDDPATYVVQLFNPGPADVVINSVSAVVLHRSTATHRVEIECPTAGSGDATVLHIDLDDVSPVAHAVRLVDLPMERALLVGGKTVSGYEFPRHTAESYSSSPVQRRT